jgi:hypothetical protein
MPKDAPLPPAIAFVQLSGLVTVGSGALAGLAAGSGVSVMLQPAVNLRATSVIVALRSVKCPIGAGAGPTP